VWDLAAAVSTAFEELEAAAPTTSTADDNGSAAPQPA
jgi:hypothetical protein